ncbi:hypothetical protein [Thalassomonas haliotis]|uniref:DUF1240 domain-containing protein n=1 Tax=Thalassomonas haliotis TaxID=485448 RepID=A0ABY7V9H8_9GAMM|nr:hypothetical protein [Thalassomonas haliotis]WDE09548.1 hypothetical protein H3N35_14500 [Thalassomonas haliotis]
MMPDTSAYLEEPQGIKYKLALISGILFCLAISGVFIAQLGDVIDNFDKLSSNSIFVEVWPLTFSVPFIVAIFALLVAAFYLRLLGKMTNEKISAGFKAFFLLAAGLIISRVLFGVTASTYLENRGYSYCYDYSEHRAGTPDVWVKAAQYCVENSGIVSSETLAWISTQEKLGNNPTIIEIQEKVQYLMAEHADAMSL